MGHNKIFTAPSSRLSTEESNLMIAMHERIPALHQISFHQIASFILLFGIGKMYDEAELYSEKFRSHELGGELMNTLTDKMLEEDLGITNGDHRAEILAFISYLFSVNSQTNTDIICSPPGIWTVTPSMYVEPAYNQCTESTRASSYYTISSCCTDEGKSTVKTIGTIGSTMGMKMPHILSSRKHRSDEKQTPNVVPARCMRETRKDVLETEDTGFILTANQLEHHHFERPAKFRVLSDVLIRARMAVEAESIGELKQKDVIYVQEIRNQCARFFWNVDGAWVSLFSNSGDRLLEQIKQ